MSQNSERKFEKKSSIDHKLLNSFSWNPSLSVEGDSFFIPFGSKEHDGGFLSLEEIDESEYGLDIPNPRREEHMGVKSKLSIKSKKHKPTDRVGEYSETKVEADNKMKTAKKKNHRKDNKKEDARKNKDNAELIKKDAEEKRSEDLRKSKIDAGFVALEEIDEAEYGLNILNPEKEDSRIKSSLCVKTKKRKHVSGVRSDFNNEIEEVGKAQNLTKKQKKILNKVAKAKKSNAKSKTVDSSRDDFDEDTVDKSEFHSWAELRLHPLIMRSIYRLGFKNPTKIQIACIPAAAYQGRDVVGASETGSGKTLAFGLPMLQRLLDEREKDQKKAASNVEEVEKYSLGGFLRALIITPTRELAVQVSDHLKEVAKCTNIRVVPIVGGMSSEKQVRLLRTRPEIIVGTPGRLWELMSEGEGHLVELHSLSFFVLDEADRMIENGHYHELQSIIDMLPMRNGSIEGQPSNTENCVTTSSFQRKRRQTFVFSATIALSDNFRKKLKRRSVNSSQLSICELNSIETLSERAGMRENTVIVNLTNKSIMANKLEESFINCREEDKDGYVYYILSVHGQGQTIVFCTSIAALRHLSSLLRNLGVNAYTVHAQMQQRARLKAMDRFRGNPHGIIIATDILARGLDICGVRTVVHYQLPHSADVYIHRGGRTARASADGCSIALISPKDKSKFDSLCKSLEKQSFQQFPIDNSIMSEVSKRLSLARQVDKILRKDSQDNAKKNWFERNAALVGLDLEEDSEDEKVNNYRKNKSRSNQLIKLQQELYTLISRPLQPKTFSRRFFAGAGVSPLLQQQFGELAKQKQLGKNTSEENERKLTVIGQECVEPLQALRNSGVEVRLDFKQNAEKRKNMETIRRERKQEKKRVRDNRRNQKKLKRGDK